MTGRPRFSDSIKRRIVAAYVSGDPVDTIAARFGCHRSYPGTLAKRRAHGVRLERAVVSTKERERLVALRKARKWSGRHLADYIGVYPSTLLDWETGNKSPVAFSLSCWREALGTSA